MMTHRARNSQNTSESEDEPHPALMNWRPGGACGDLADEQLAGAKAAGIEFHALGIASTYPEMGEFVTGDPIVTW